MQRMSKEHILLKKLDEFIRKYYRNRLMRGVLWAVTLLAAYYLILIICEYFFHFNQVIRTVLFFAFLSTAVFLFFRLIFIPILQLIKIGKIISHVKAAEIIGNHFPEIQDKLLNTLQLMRKSEHGNDQSELLTASIAQKTEALKIFPFTKVIDFTKNLRYIRYAVIPVFIIVVLALLSPEIISEPTNRIVRFYQPFIPPLSFRLEVLNKTLRAVQQDDFELNVVATGDEIPSEVFIKTKTVTYKLTKKRGFVFSCLFKSVQENIPFVITAGDFISQKYEIVVLPKPILLSFDVEVTFPSYLNKSSEKIENVGDITIPEGSEVKWNFYTKDVSQIKLRVGNIMNNLNRDQKNTFTHTETKLTTTSYSIRPLNDTNQSADSLVYSVFVVNDGYPTIVVSETLDSTLNTSVFCKGSIKDDYGFSKLTFNYDVINHDDSILGNLFSENILIDRNIDNQVFYHSIDLQKLMPESGMTLRYFFEICDNDGVHGPKCTKSELRKILTPSIEEIVERTDQNAESMKDKIEQSLKESNSIQKTLDGLNKKMVDQNNISWQEKRKMEELIRANFEIGEKVRDAIAKNKENMANEEKYLETSKRITDKQNQLNELMELLLTDEMKQMIEEMQNLIKQVDKAKLSNLLDKMKVSNKELEIQLDRHLELMKKIEFERKIENLSNELRKIADKQDILAKNTEEQKQISEKLLDAQNNINKNTDSVSKQIHDLKEEGKKFETPVDIGVTEEKQDSLQRILGDSKKKLEEKRNREASKSQREAARQMRDLARQMEESQQENEDEQLAEDASNIRMIVENLVRLSFEQEDIITRTRIIARSDPRYPEIILSQREFIQKLTIIEDSLNSIGKRQLMLKPFITKEISAIKRNIDLTLEAMDSRNINLAVAKQQYSMTSINNLALLLNESLEKMNEQRSSGSKSKGGKKSCPNPGAKGAKPSMKGIRELQENLGKQLQQLKAGMDATSGKNGGVTAKQNAMNKQIAKLAAQQEALRNEMQQYQNQRGSKGVKNQGDLNDVEKEMEQIEHDLINKSITKETIQRQQKIMSRLLESEKAEQMRDQEEKRESEEAKSRKTSNPNQYFKYNAKKRAGIDHIELTLPVVSSFYKSKISSYTVKIGY